MREGVEEGRQTKDIVDERDKELEIAIEEREEKQYEDVERVVRV